MIEPRLFVCSGFELSDNDPRKIGRKIINLSASGRDANVTIRVEDVSKVFQKHLRPRLVDLLEIASYVYSADCSTRRGNSWQDDEATESWDRDFRFVIPVRDVEFWQRNDVKKLLVQILNFLSNDKYQLDFEELTQERYVQEYLQFSDEEDWPFYGVKRVLMFSGGLDSLAGAVVMAQQGEKLVLVSHRSVPQLSKRQKELYQQLKFLYSNPMLHIPVWINKDSNIGREPTQRTRSFLYSALGVVVAESLQASGVSFFENGIVSLNLPVADEVLRARASRTTHPFALDLFSDLYSLVTERGFVVDNPFVFKTKSDIVRAIVDCGAEMLIQYTCSCAHTMFKSKSQWHCGSCSQCIDRRIAIVATNQAHNDPEVDYESDVFIGKRKDGYDQAMAIGYTRFATELHRMGDKEFSARFSLELSRAVRPFEDRRDAAEKFIELHLRHGREVSEVLQAQLIVSANRMLSGTLEPTSMLGLIAGSEHLASTWKRYAVRVANRLKSGVPNACKTHKPTDERHLQEICDGILKADENDLVREFPFMRWSSSLTKPDWSSEALGLWIELKYIRQNRDIRNITEDIAADITKYGDNARKTLYLIYDPSHLVTDEQKFLEPLKKRDGMFAEFIR